MTKVKKPTGDNVRLTVYLSGGIMAIDMAKEEAQKIINMYIATQNSGGCTPNSIVFSHNFIINFYHVQGMFYGPCALTPAERVAKIMEKQQEAGEEWKKNIDDDDEEE
jgi:hypothetical protein